MKTRFAEYQLAFFVLDSKMNRILAETNKKVLFLGVLRLMGEFRLTS